MSAAIASERRQPSPLVPCISERASQDSLRCGRSMVPGSPSGQSEGEQESPRRKPCRSQVRTVAGAGLGPGRIAQGGKRSASGDGQGTEMEQPNVWVGVDVSKGQLEVALRPSGEQFSLANDERAVRTLVKRLLPLGCARIVVEATGGYETLVVAALHAGGLP